jgi:hypothetical protein
MKWSAVGLALLCAAPAVSAQAGPALAGSRSSFQSIPKHRVRIGTPNALPGIRSPWISEQAPLAGADRPVGPRLPGMVQPAVSKLDADQPPAPADDVIIIPVTTILIALLVVLIVVAVD